MTFHQHDCDCCHYLGSEEKTEINYDYYVCAQHGSSTVIARFGDDGDYMSGLMFVKSSAINYMKELNLSSIAEAVIQLKLEQEKDNPLFEATCRAIDQKILDNNLHYAFNVKPSQKIKP